MTLPKGVVDVNVTFPGHTQLLFKLKMVGMKVGT